MEMEDKFESGEATEEIISTISKEGEEKVTTGISEEEKNYQFLFSKVKRLEILNYIILALLGVILIYNFFSTFSIFSIFRNPVNSTSASFDQKDLPKSMDKEKANEIMNEIKDYYNSDDDKKLYNVLGEYARTLITFDDFKKSIENLSMLGKIINTSFTHHTYLQNDSGADWYLLNYVAKYESGNGTATVTIKVSKNEWEVVGFKFNIDTMGNSQN